MRGVSFLFLCYNTTIRNAVNKMEKLLLIDGNAMLFRAYYGTLNSRNMTTSNGIPTNAVYGFILMLNKAIEKIEPDAIMVAWDAGKPTFRHETYEAYKGTRKPLDEELVVQFPIIREYLDAAGITRYEKEGFEADDIIGSMAKSHPELMTTILTGDKDLLQLIDDTTHVLLMRKGITEMEVLDTEGFGEKYNGLKPIQMIDLKGLMGDASDNIPGVAGVGEKTALRLISEYGSVENVYENISQIKGKLKEKLEKDHDKAIMSKDLATIYTKMDLPIEVSDLAYDGTNPGVNDFFRKYEMRSFMTNEKKREKKKDVVQVTKWPDMDTKDLLLMAVCSDESFLQTKLHGFVASADSNVYYIEANDALEDSSFISMLKNEKTLRTWDVKMMLHILDRYGFPQAVFKEDLHLAGFLLHSQATNTDALVEAMSIRLPESIHDLSLKSKEDGAWSKKRMIPVYASWCEQLSTKIESIFNELKNQEMMDLYQNIELPLTSILYEMEKEGMDIDENILNEQGVVIQDKLEELSSQIYRYANMEFNINSPKQLAAVLFDELNLSGGGKKRSTSADVLEKMRGRHPIIDCLLEYRKYAKIRSTYIEGLKKHIQSDGKIHTTFNQTMTQTGRLSSSEPNLQNISIRDEAGREIRKAFVAPENTVYLSADYSQIELRMLAHMADEKHMVEAFNEDVDIHNRTATLIFGVPSDEVTSDMRRTAKTVNFGIIYGQSAHGLSEQLGVSRAQAKQFIDAYYESYSNIKDYMDKVIDQCRENGYVTTLFNRRRQIPEIRDKNFLTRQFGERAAMNAPIQGSAADLIKIAMIRCDKAMKEANVKSKMLLQIHDELIFMVYEDEKDLMMNLVKEAMENAMKLKVPLKADANFGKSWYEAK